MGLTEVQPTGIGFDKENPTVLFKSKASISKNMSNMH